jgi:hypothetical protein
MLVLAIGFPLLGLGLIFRVRVIIILDAL